MTGHLNDAQLLAYLEDNLASQDRESVSAHLRTCLACSARLERLAQTTKDLATTLQAVGDQVPLTPARSWEAVARRWRGQRTRSLSSPFRPLLRHVATLAVLVTIVGGLAGLIHTLAVTSPAPPQPTPTPVPSRQSGPSPAPGPLPRPYLDQQGAPVSLLILGSDGESTASAKIDSLTLLYLDPEAGNGFLLSIPCDLYVDVPGHAQARAGSVYEMGQRGDAGVGLVLARDTISATLGLPIQHVALVRFESFVALIDTIGGVDVDVLHTIEDPAFPDDRGGHAPLLIPVGKQHLDGARALRYVRTRVAPEPGFDRAFRQRQLIMAAHDRVTRLDLLPGLISQASTLWSAVADGIETDLSLSNAIDLALQATAVTADSIDTASLGEHCALPYTTPAGQRVLLPQPDEIEALMENLLEGER